MKPSVLIVGVPSTEADRLLRQDIGASEVWAVPTVEEARAALRARAADVLVVAVDEGRELLQEVARHGDDIVCFGVGEGEAQDEWPTLSAPLSAESLRAAIAPGWQTVGPDRLVVVEEGSAGAGLPGTHVAYEPRHTDIQALLATSGSGPIVLHAPPEQVFEAVRELRRGPDAARLHLVALTASQHPRPRGALWNAGVDDVWTPSVAPGALAERLSARCDVLSRLSSAPGPMKGWRGVVGTPGWASLPELLAETLSAFLGVDLEVAGTVGSPSHWSQIALVDARAEVEVSATVGADEGSLASLVEILFGEADIALYDDLVGELANVVMGAMKARWLEDGLFFTSGLPTAGRENAPAPWSLRGLGTTTFSLQRRGGPDRQVSIAMAVAASRRPRRRIQAAALEETMVLAADVRGAGGEPIALAGRRLTRQIIESIQVLGGGCDVVVASR